MPLETRKNSLELLGMLYHLADGVIDRLVAMEDLSVDEDPLMISDYLDFLSSRGWIELNYDGTEIVRFVSMSEDGALEAELLLRSQETQARTGVDTEESTDQIDVFISHGSEDEPIASALIRLIERSLGVESERIRCTSVEGYGLKAGTLTEDVLRQEIRNSTTFIALLTPGSITSSYVLFELGARWGADLSLVPLLARGADYENLPGPLPGRTAIFANKRTDVQKMLHDLAHELTTQTKRADMFERELSTLLSKANADPVQKSTTLTRSDAHGPKELSDEAQTLLVGAIEDPHGSIMRTRGKSGPQIVANGQRFWDSTNPFTKAIWVEAFESLLDRGLIKDLGEGSVFQVTAEGYRIGETYGATVPRQ